MDSARAPCWFFESFTGASPSRASASIFVLGMRRSFGPLRCRSRTKNRPRALVERTGNPRSKTEHGRVSTGGRASRTHVGAPVNQVSSRNVRKAGRVGSSPAREPTALASPDARAAATPSLGRSPSQPMCHRAGARVARRFSIGRRAPTEVSNATRCHGRSADRAAIGLRSGAIHSITRSRNESSPVRTITPSDVLERDDANVVGERA